jgi:TnpA family transposase
MTVKTRLAILSDDEINDLYGMPKLKQDEKPIAFLLSEQEQNYFKCLPNTASKINFVLQLGYFKVSRNFYRISFQRLRDDIWFIINSYFPEEKFPKKNIGTCQHYTNQKAILELYEYKKSTPQFLIELSQHAKQIAKRDITPIFIFDGLLDYCEQCKIIRPAYSTLEGIVSTTIKAEENRLSDLLNRLTNKSTRKSIDNLLNCDDIFYNLTLLKKDPKSLTPKEMRKELAKQQCITEIYNQSKLIIPNLNISRKKLQYYADLAEYYSVYSLKRMKLDKVRLYLLCFVWQRFIKVNDHLITYFIYKTESYIKEAKDYGIAGVFKAKLEYDENKQEAGKILKIISNDKIADNMVRPEAFKIVPKDKFNQFSDNVAKTSFDEIPYHFECYAKRYNAIKLNLRPIFSNITLTHKKESHLKAAIEFFNSCINSSKKIEDQSMDKIPLSFIPKKFKSYISNKRPIKVNNKVERMSHIDGNLYEVMLYIELQKAIKAGNVCVTDSISYRSLDDELISYDIWTKDKEHILAGLSNSLIQTDVSKLLQDLEVVLESAYKKVNKRIKTKENNYIKIIDEKKLTWKLPYRSSLDNINNPFYENLPLCNIGDVIAYTEKQTTFMEEFSHILSKNSRTTPQAEHLYAYIVASGMGIGKGRIADTSDIKKLELDSVEQKYIRLETLGNANNIIINNIAKLPVFEYYNLSEYGIHASIVGQKVATKYHTFKARYSRKYFGLDLGVVAFTCVANHIPINTRIIGSNEHESHYVLDIVYNQTSDLKIAAVSGDMHSVNRVNFALLHLFGYQFMPRFTKINTRTNKSLVSFMDKSSYKDCLVRPSHKINKQLIMKEWDNILHILASLAMKETSQSIIIRKLSSYTKQNNTLKALIEFDKVIMSIYMLKYIDDNKVRQRVYRALNRGEAFHQLRSGILKISGKQIDGRTELDLNISNECNRLLANCIIFYNTSLLSSLLELHRGKKDKKICEKIKRLSPVAWRHINLVGKFEFLQNRKILDIQTLAEDLANDSRVYFKAA